VAAVLAAGGATAVIDLLVDNVNPGYGVVMAFAFKILIAYAQNYLETAGKIPVLLPTPGLVPSVGEGPAVAVGTVDAVAEKVGEAVGEVTGTVESLTGELIGEVVDVDHEEE
jgi:hypothetical protein